MGAIIFTFDLEEWWHVVPCPMPVSDWPKLEQRSARFTHDYLDFLDHEGISSTFFVVGWMAKTNPALVREIVSRGHEIGCHSMWHESVEKIGPERFKQDLATSKQVLEDLTGSPIYAYRAPSFTITPASLWAFEILLESGFTVDASVTAGARFSGGGFNGWPTHGPFRLMTLSGELLCFPMTDWKFAGRSFTVTGGGYLRILPKLLLSSILRGQEFTMTYLHPSDFDPDRPGFAGDGLVSRLRKKLKWGNLWDKLRLMHKLSKTYSIREYSTQLKPDELPVVDIGRPQ